MRKRRPKRVWTVEEEEIIRNEYPTTPTKELAIQLNIDKDRIRGKATRMGIYKESWTHGRQVWSAEHLEMMHNLFATTSSTVLAQKMNRSVNSVNSQAKLLGLNKDKKYIEKLYIQQGEDLKRRGAKTRYKKGRAPENKGKKVSLEVYEKMKPNMFKLGHTINERKPIGYERITADGYREVKVEQPKRFDLLHRFMWKVWKGPIPKGHVITFKDGDQKNCDIGNLLCMSKAYNMLQNTIQRYPTELRNTMWQIGKLKSKIKKVTNQ